MRKSKQPKNKILQRSVTERLKLSESICTDSRAYFENIDIM